MTDLLTWLRDRGGIVRRQIAVQAGHTPAAIRRWTTAGLVRSIRRTWLALPALDDDRVRAAQAGGRVACVSLARARGWWIPEDADDALHISISPHGRSDGLIDFDGVAHWSAPITAADPSFPVESPEDALDHIANCLAPEHAQAVWDSAVKRERLDAAALRRVEWRTPAARDCAERATGLADSGLESIFVFRFSSWGVPFRQQVVIAGRPVDTLIGEWLVVQVDGHAFHSSSADRTRDSAHDAELRLRGYTVLRFTYAQVLHDWPAVARTLSRVLATGAHLSPR
ncbi:endonuclease domain-containing protein [Microbacterium sp. NPDC091313]